MSSKCQNYFRTDPKQKIQQRLIQLLHADNADIHLIDGFPIDVCLRTRARKSKIFKGEAAHGYCASKDKYFYGFQGHLLVDARGIPVNFTLTAANIDERDAAYDMIESIEGLMLGDKGYIRPQFKEDCQAVGINLQTPLRKNMKYERPKSFFRLIMRVRRRIETVTGQLAERFEIEKCRCRDIWHMTSIITRKLLAHNIGSFFNIKAGRPAIQFENLISAE
ncbi:IS982 family transposase [Endozoicomonas ascidiicola]|uniref:IS982 family transposase n=1 Tax=Endozoicomonas ascidiicola TaxID=1698521 RepID=UPI0008347E19|nr:IS982 family transposase [Endozoicomonas ascidiicola]